MIRNALLLLAVAVCWLASMPARAGHDSVVDARLPSGIVVSADFQAGKRTQPAVLVLHGFLQTHAFPTVTSITQALSGAGYTTLAPTLSLGISKRHTSLPCEAVHLHTLDDDVAEIAFWVHWLQKKGYTRIILVGHSFGSLQILTYLSRSPSAAVTQVLMISLTDVEMKQSALHRAQLAEILRGRVSRGDRVLIEEPFNLCRKYASPPAAFLSYLSISRTTILESLAQSKVPVQVIMGGQDDRMGPDWVDKLVSRGIRVRVIPGASHFFDNQYEFDLQEAVLLALHDPLTRH